jgi:hypothetical protein
MTNQRFNIRFNYLYRDFGNFKLFNSVIFVNPSQISILEIESKIKQKLVDGEYFDPKKWKIPILAFPEYDHDLDHQWNEYESVELTMESPTENRTILQFLSEIG